MRFRLQGRSDDIIKVSQDEIYLDDLAGAIAKFREFSPFFQVTVATKGTTSFMHITIEITPGADLSSARSLESPLQKELIRSSPFLSKHWNTELFGEINIAIAPSGTIERIGRTGKIRRIIEKRSI